MIKYKTNLNCNLNQFHNWNITEVWYIPVNECFARKLKVVIICSSGLEYYIESDRLLCENRSKAITRLHLNILNNHNMANVYQHHSSDVFHSSCDNPVSKSMLLHLLLGYNRPFFLNCRQFIHSVGGDNCWDITLNFTCQSKWAWPCENQLAAYTSRDIGRRRCRGHSIL